MFKNIIAAFAALALLPSVAGAVSLNVEQEALSTRTYTALARDTNASIIYSAGSAETCTVVATILAGNSVEVAPRPDTSTTHAANVSSGVTLSASGSGTLTPGAEGFSVKFAQADQSRVTITCAPTVGGSSASDGVLEAVTSATNTFGGDNYVVDPTVNTWNSINPNTRANAIMSSCGPDKPCTIGSTEQVTCTDSFSSCDDENGDGLCDDDERVKWPQDVGVADGACDAFGVDDITAFGPEPNYPADFSIADFPPVASYPMVGQDESQASFSGIWAGSYDNVISQQACLIGGNHNLCGPSLKSGHFNIIGSNNSITGHQDFGQAYGFANLNWVAESGMYPSSGGATNNMQFGRGNEIRSPYADPQYASNNTQIGKDNTIEGGVSHAEQLGRDNVISGTETGYNPAGNASPAPLNDIWQIGSFNGRAARHPQDGYNYPSGTLNRGRYSDVWMEGQTVIQSHPGFDNAGATTLGGMQEWTLFGRHIVTNGTAQDLTSGVLGSRIIQFNASGLWRFHTTVTCAERLDMDDTGSNVRPAIAVWEQSGIFFVKNYRNTNEVFGLIPDGYRSAQTTSTAQTTAVTAQLTDLLAGGVPALIQYDGTGGTANMANVEFNITFGDSFTSLGLNIDNNSGVTLACVADLNVIEMRNP